MSTDSSTDATRLATIPTITLHDPMTGLPCQVLRPAYEHALKTGQPIVIRLMPHMDEGVKPPPAEHEDDEVIAEIIDDNPGLLRSEIEDIAKRQYRPLGAGAVKRRMADGMPLRLAGYHTAGKGRATRYFPPSN